MTKQKIEKIKELWEKPLPDGNYSAYEIERERGGVAKNTILELLDALEAETKRADKWERRYTETSEHLDEVLAGNHESLDAIREKVAELQVDRDQLRNRAKALERAIRKYADKPINMACVTCVNYDNKDPCADHCSEQNNYALWRFDQERFTAKEDGDD